MSPCENLRNTLTILAKIYAELLGYEDEWLFETWMGLLLEDGIHKCFDRYEISIYPRVSIYFSSFVLIADLSTGRSRVGRSRLLQPRQVAF